MANTSGTPLAPPRMEPATHADFQAQVPCRAYELYEQRGGEHGHDVEDRLQSAIGVIAPRLKLELVDDGVRLVTA